jgi:hypothetical protein
MSTPKPTTGPAAPPPTPAPAPSQLKPPPEPVKREIRIVSHCTLFYWWPVWAIGFLMWLITMFSGQHMVTVPAGTTAKFEGTIVKVEGKKKGDAQVEEKVDIYELPPPANRLAKDPAHKGQPLQPYLHMSDNKNLGIFFVAILLLVIGITNIPLRGLWSVIVIVLLLSVVIIFALLEWWTVILGWLSFLDIRINAAGYFVISAALFALWLVIMLIFDRQVYMVFSSGQMRVRQEIGDAETMYDTTGMQVKKERSDLFRHWILGLGSGDLIVKTAGANSQEFHMPNVLFIGRKVAEIEQLMAQKQVVAGKPQ